MELAPTAQSFITDTLISDIPTRRQNMQTNNQNHRSFLEQYYKDRSRAALYKLLFSAVLVLLFFNLAWYLPRNFERNIFSALAAVSVVIFFFESWSVLGNSWRALKLGKSYPPHIYEIGRGLAFFEKQDTQMCANLAAHGYMLTSVFFGLYRFERTFPVECDFFIDLAEIRAGDEGFPEYIYRFEQAGWHYLCSNSALHFFRAPKGSETIFTDSPSLLRKYVKMRSLSAWCVVAGLFTAFSALFMLQIFPPELGAAFYLLLGVGLGLSLTMSVFAVLNHRLITRLNSLRRNKV